MTVDAFRKVQDMLDRTANIPGQPPLSRTEDAIQILLVLHGVRRAARLDADMSNTARRRWHKEIQAMLTADFPHVQLIYWGKGVREPLLVDMAYAPNRKYVKAIVDASHPDKKWVGDLDPKVSVPMGKLLGYGCKYVEGGRMVKGHYKYDWDSFGGIELGVKFAPEDFSVTRGFPLHLLGFGCSAKDTTKATFWKHMRAVDKVRDKANAALEGKTLRINGKVRLTIERFLVISNH